MDERWHTNSKLTLLRKGWEPHILAWSTTKHSDTISSITHSMVMLSVKEDKGNSFWTCCRKAWNSVAQSFPVGRDSTRNTGDIGFGFKVIQKWFELKSKYWLQSILESNTVNINIGGLFDSNVLLFKGDMLIVVGHVPILSIALPFACVWLVIRVPMNVNISTYIKTFHKTYVHYIYIYMMNLYVYIYNNPKIDRTLGNMEACIKYHRTTILVAHFSAFHG